jgi:hypothetical protein
VDAPATATDYWLSKLFYDLQQPALAARYLADPDAVLVAYPLSDPVRRALRENDVQLLAPRVNAYLLRYYFGIIGMPDHTFIDKIRETD